MTTQQPDYVCVGNIGDLNPIDHGGGFVFKDATGVYPPRLEVLTRHSDADESRFTIYRIDLEPCTFRTNMGVTDAESVTYTRFEDIPEDCDFKDGVLSDNKYHPDHDAWFAKPEFERKERPQDTTYLKNVADFVSMEIEEFIALFLSEHLEDRAVAWKAVGDYHGMENFDSEPLVLTLEEVQKRYADIITPSGRFKLPNQEAVQKLIKLL